MFENKIKQLSESDIKYISKQIQRLNEDKNNSLVTKDSLWRIATNAELFPPNQLSPKGNLTPEQRRTTWQFIRYFRGRNRKSLLGYVCEMIQFLNDI